MSCIILKGDILTIEITLFDLEMFNSLQLYIHIYIQIYLQHTRDGQYFDNRDNRD